MDSKADPTAAEPLTPVIHVVDGRRRTRRQAHPFEEVTHSTGPPFEQKSPPSNEKASLRSASLPSKGCRVNSRKGSRTVATREGEPLASQMPLPAEQELRPPQDPTRERTATEVPRRRSQFSSGSYSFSCSYCSSYCWSSSYSYSRHARRRTTTAAQGAECRPPPRVFIITRYQI